MLVDEQKLRMVRFQTDPDPGRSVAADSPGKSADSPRLPLAATLGDTGRAAVGRAG